MAKPKTNKPIPRTKIGMYVSRMSRRGKYVLVALFFVMASAGGIGSYSLNKTEAGVCRTRVYKKGMSGWCVKQIQYTVGAPMTGYFGSITHSKVWAYQGGFGLKKDGIVGKNTWRAICQSLSRDRYNPNRGAIGC